MGVVQSKKKEVKAYASKYGNSLMQYSSSATSSQHQANSTLSHKKQIESDAVSKKTSIYSTDSASRSATPATLVSTSKNIASAYKNKELPDTIHYETTSISSITHQSNSFYLPKDWDVKEYQYNLHFALKSLFAGNVTQAVAPKLKKGAHVVQMGTCSGPWIMDMATQFPQCTFTAVEVIPGSLQALPSLPNIEFQRDTDFKEGLNFEDGSIDYIHFRSMGINIGIDKWPNLYKEVRRILKPDGIIRIEEIHNAPSGTVMIESFIETLRQILSDHNQDFDIAPKHGSILQDNGFQVIESKKKTVYYGGEDKLSEDLVIVILNGFEDLSSVLAPRLGLDVEDYRHRVEMICAQCVRNNTHMDWYSWVAKVAPESST
ncbi:S-adenosyl-L-methionine-dependent methyltransferase [Helicostylum pulchrum]|uniref:Methyltransferase domain-containing protein n=1 Tax=Helicostylum pulchrum TaxID=562976 RepID=A0ABP9Y6F3_9FUNG|nr:S-adenosyl-L-methionine-dependent methyltransferase [Helicostylum pulchrum]